MCNNTARRAHKYDLYNILLMQLKKEVKVDFILV